MTSNGVRPALDPRRPDPSRSAVRPGLVLASRVCAGIAGLIGLAGLLGWMFDVPALRQILPGLGAMRFNTALSITLLAVSRFVPRAIGAALASLVEVLVALTLFQYASTVSVGIDQLFVADPGAAHYPGRMAVVTSVSLGLLAAAQLLAHAGRALQAQTCALLVFVVATLTALGYAYDVPSLYSLRPFSTIALHTAIALLLLSVAVIATVPRGALHWVLTGRDPGATLVRRLLPVALIVLPLIGFAALAGERAGWLGRSATAAMIVVACALVVALVTWSAALRISRVDRRRAQAMAELTALRIDLERQVQERASQLQHGRNHIAVLEDRQRIAADLHDIVIQRLFAAGMFLQSGGATIEDPETRDRVDAAVEAMDTAIKDLRTSIFELGARPGGGCDLTTAVDDVCVESARMLGFVPEVLVDDPDLDAERARNDILAVLREALANVARHAEATRVDVALRSQDGGVSLTVVDDGKGISETVLRSGTRNMVDRARDNGGNCTWTQIHPHGTKVHWFVPGPATAEA